MTTNPEEGNYLAHVNETQEFLATIEKLNIQALLELKRTVPKS